MNYYPLISIIVPIYNVESYLKRCIESIVGQSYDNLEIILVNDGSTDSSGSLCDELAENDARIKVIHSANGGAGRARNIGLANSQGEYFVYVDADDYLGPDYVFNLISTILGAQTLLAVTGMTPVKLEDDNVAPIKTAPTIYSLISAPNAIYLAHKKPLLPFSEAPHGKIFAATLAPYLIFPEDKHNEDQFIMYQVFYAAGTVAYENANDYYYLTDRPTSLTNKVADNFFDTFEARRQIIAFAKEHDMPLVEQVAIQYYYARLIGSFARLSLADAPHLASHAYQMITNERATALHSPYTWPRTKMALLLSYLPKPLFTKILCSIEKGSTKK